MINVLTLEQGGEVYCTTNLFMKDTNTQVFTAGKIYPIKYIEENTKIVLIDDTLDEHSIYGGWNKYFNKHSISKVFQEL